MYNDARFDMNKFLRVKKLVDDGLIAKIDAARILCITTYVYNQKVKKLEKQGELNENKESEN